jgi:hypothetical protein
VKAACREQVPDRGKSGKEFRECKRRMVPVKRSIHRTVLCGAFGASGGPPRHAARCAARRAPVGF